MPILKIITKPKTPSDSRSTSPHPPQFSPITPPRRSLDGNSTSVTTTEAHAQPQGQQNQQQTAGIPPRQTFTHSQPDQVGIPPPAPVPISLDANPDAIALRSAISVLQVQQRRAAADIQALSKAQSEALQHTDEFLQDLLSGKVNPSNPLPSGHPDAKPWTSLPKAQDVVRCPPINWSQYAVVGESLDKLHAEQVARPTQGTPGVVGAGGVYEFKAGDGKQEKYDGIAAPYAPLKDKIDKKSKGKK